MSLEHHHFNGQDLGFYRPNNLLKALKDIQVSFGPDQNAYTTPEAIAYFYCYEIACRSWRNAYRRIPAAPFVGLELVSIDLPENPGILRIGCPSLGSLEAETAYLNQINIKPRRHTILDISPLPIKLLSSTHPRLSQFVQADAATYDLHQFSPDIILTDLLFSRPDQVSSAILDNINRSLAPAGHLLTRVCFLPPAVRENYFRLLDYSGLFWGSFARNTYGTDGQGRDLFYGLTPDQWLEIGGLYAQFLKSQMYSQDSFQSESEIINFFQDHGFTISHSQTISERVGAGHVSFLSLNLQSSS